MIAPTLRGLLAGGDALRVVTFDEAPLAAAFTATPAGRAFVLGGPLTPDQIVYTGSWPLLLDVPADVPAEDLPGLLDEGLRAHLAAHGALPIIVVMPGLGLFAAGDSWSEADTARHVYLDSLRVADRALSLGGVRALSDAERTFIEAWEAESYRRAVAAGAAGAAGRRGRWHSSPVPPRASGSPSPQTSWRRVATSCWPTSTRRSRRRTRGTWRLASARAGPARSA